MNTRKIYCVYTELVMVRRQKLIHPMAVFFCKKVEQGKFSSALKLLKKHWTSFTSLNEVYMHKFEVRCMVFIFWFSFN